MAIPLPLAEFICAEHKFRPLPPHILLLGRQTMTFGKTGLQYLADRFDLAMPTRIERDMYTLHARLRPEVEFVSDASFFAMLGVTGIDAIDVNDSEGANILLDLCRDIPHEHRGRYDFILNGSVLDNVWDPPAAMRNIGRLLSETGRVVHIETETSSPFSYTALSPSWYFDYYVINGWQDCRLYVAAVEGFETLVTKPWAVMGFNPRAQARANAFSPPIGDRLGISVVVAEKNSKSTIEKAAVQSHYRSDEQWDEFMALAQPMLELQRPLHLGARGTGRPIPTHQNVWVSCGWWGEDSSSSWLRNVSMRMRHLDL